MMQVATSSSRRWILAKAIRQIVNGPSLSTLTIRPDPHYVDFRKAPDDFDPSAAVVYDSIITQSESDALLQDLQPQLKRRRYERGHWDAVIVKYKETELTLSNLSPTSKEMLQRLQSHVYQHHLQPLLAKNDSNNNDTMMNDVARHFLPFHVIDLAKEGELNAHVDSVRFSGHLVCGLSLLSPSIMRLKPADPEHQQEVSSDDEQNELEGHVDLYLPPLSLYVLSGVGRYKYTHELLPTGSTFTINTKEEQSIEVHRERRISIIFRDVKT